MAAAYAALVSLMNTVDAIPNNPCAFTSLDKYQTESLREKLNSLLQFVEDYDFRGGKTKDAVEDLKSQIGSAAHAAEVVIEAHIADRIITDPSLYLHKMIALMRFFIDKFYEHGFRVSRSKELIENLKTKIKYAAHAVDVMISDEAKEWSAFQGITKEAVEDLKTRIASAVDAAEILLYFLRNCYYLRRSLSEHSQMIIEEMGSLIDKKMIEVVRSLIEDFEHYDYHEDIIKEGLEDLKSQIESLAHATDVMISEGAKESVQNDPTQGITKEAVEDLKTRIAHAARAAKVMLNSVKDFDFRRLRISEQSQKIKEDMDSLMEKAKYVKEQRKHEELDLQKIIEDMGSLIDKKMSARPFEFYLGMVMSCKN